MKPTEDLASDLAQFKDGGPPDKFTRQGLYGVVSHDDGSITDSLLCLMTESRTRCHKVSSIGSVGCFGFLPIWRLSYELREVDPDWVICHSLTPIGSIIGNA